MRNHIVVCGPVSWNQLVYLDRLPEPRPHMQFALEQYETVGGTSAGKALHLARLGREVACHTVLGDDDRSLSVRSVLAAAGVEVVARVVPGAGERHLNLMTRAGERVSVYLTTPAFAEPDAARFLALAADSAALVMDLSETSRFLLDSARATGVPVWTDVHDYDGQSGFQEPFIRAADYIFMNADAMSDPLPFMRAQVDAGATAVVCTLGAEGAMAVDAGGLHRVRAVEVDVRDTNGAGDAFLAGYLDATLAGASTGAALDAAARQAAVALGTRHLHPAVEGLLP